MLKLAAAFFLVLLFLEMLLIVLIVGMEYRINAVEMALKKIHGYSLLHRIWPILAAITLSTVAGISLTLVANGELSLKMSLWDFVPGMVLVLFGWTYVYMKAKNMEKHRGSAILKGERI